MGFILSLSIKNLMRYKRRTFITAIAIAVGIGAFIFMDGMLLGIELESERNLVKFETGSARIMNKTYWDDHDYLIPKYNIPDRNTVMKAVTEAGIPATPRITVWGKVRKLIPTNYEESNDYYPATVTGIDQKTEGDVFLLNESVIINSKTEKENGRYFNAVEEVSLTGSVALVGKDLAKNLKVSVGDEIQVLETKTADGQNTTLNATIVGLLNTPDPIINKQMVFLPLAYIEQALLMKGAATDIVLLYPEYTDINDQVAKTKNAIAGVPGSEKLVTKSFLDIASTYLSISRGKRGGSAFLLIVVFLIAVIGVSNTMLIAVFERRREIAMMRALGMREGSILVSFILEASGIGFIGGIGGLIIGILGNLYMVNIGMDFREMMDEMGDIGYRSLGIFKSAWNFQTMITAFICGLIFTGIMALLPAIMALRKDITKNLNPK
ncbi:MAG: ABC transporter permease [Spirochaetales bacterium]|nr:ABC transporter permease [Spirochaetales bacterium]